MDKHEEGFFECECGKLHQVETKNIVVGTRVFDALLESVKASGYKKILVFNSLENTELIYKLKQKFSKDFKLDIVYLAKCNATLLNAEHLEDKGQELVVAMGSEELISLAKYFAYAYENELFIYPVGNFTDFTFSKYSRLYDGVQFNFYQTASPTQIFVSVEDNPFSVYQSYYISSKYIALFDDMVGEYVYESKICDRLKAFIKNSLTQYIKYKPQNSIDLNYKNIWMLIRLGQAMSFYGETKAFFGGEKGMVDLMQSLKYGSDFLELSTLSLKLIIN